MGKGRTPRQVGVSEEVVCAAEATVRFLCMSAQLDIWALWQARMGNSNTIRAIPSCWQQKTVANSLHTSSRQLSHSLSDMFSVRLISGSKCKRLGRAMEEYVHVHTGYAWFYVKRERKSVASLDARAAQRLEKDWTEFLCRRAFFNFYLLDIICSRAR